MILAVPSLRTAFAKGQVAKVHKEYRKQYEKWVQQLAGGASKNKTTKQKKTRKGKRGLDPPRIFLKGTFQKKWTEYVALDGGDPASFVSQPDSFFRVSRFELIDYIFWLDWELATCRRHIVNSLDDGGGRARKGYYVCPKPCHKGMPMGKGPVKNPKTYCKFFRPAKDCDCS